MNTTSQVSYWLAISLLFSHSVVSESLEPVGLQHARLPWPSLSPGVCSDSSLLSWWCHPTISSCHLLLLLPSVFPSISIYSNESALPIGWSKYWSFSFSISPSNEYSALISFSIACVDILLSKGLSRVFSSTTIWKHQLFNAQPSLWSNSYIPTWLLEKPSYIIWTFVDKVMFLLFNMLSRFVIAFLPWNKHL